MSIMIMRVTFLAIVIVLAFRFEANCQITNDEVTVITVPGDHVLMEKTRVLVYPNLTKMSHIITNLDDELKGEKVAIILRIYKDRIEFYRLKASSRFSDSLMSSIDEKLRKNMKYFLLDKPILKGAKYYEFSHILNLGSG